jgi:copper chaperone CopZ
MSDSNKCPGFLVHSAPGRCRFKIPDKRHDAAYFQDLKAKLQNMGGVERIDINPLTASVLIGFDSSQIQVQALSEQLQAADYFELSDSMPTQTVWQRASSGLDRFDHMLQESTSGQIDFKSLLFILLFIMAIRQLHQGVIFSAAATLFWYALQVLLKDEPA